MTFVMNLDDFGGSGRETYFATLVSAIVFEEKKNEARGVPKQLSQPNNHWS